MKSSLVDLRRRGYIDDLDLWLINDYSNVQLHDLLENGEAYQRTLAIRILNKRLGYRSEYVKALLELLCHETALYTRLEIERFLEKGNRSTFDLMVPFLGKAFSYEHEIFVSKKTSYPLPRDLIARIMGKMPITTDVLFDAYHQIPYESQLPMIDAIGYHMYYHPTTRYFTFIKRQILMHPMDYIFINGWIVALSGIKTKENEVFLKQLLHKYQGTLLEEQIERSLKLSKMK